MLWASRQGDPIHSLRTDGAEGRRQTFRLGHSNKLPAGNPDKLSDKVQKHRPLWDARHAWGLGIPEALCHHHRSVSVSRSPVLSSGPLLLLQPLSRLYAVTIDRMCCSFGFGDNGLAKCQLFCGRAVGPVKE